MIIFSNDISKYELKRGKTRYRWLSGFLCFDEIVIFYT
jgi:hypothetical protein